jgi:hypothetical protein
MTTPLLLANVGTAHTCRTEKRKIKRDVRKLSVMAAQIRVKRGCLVLG